MGRVKDILFHGKCERHFIHGKSERHFISWEITPITGPEWLRGFQDVKVPRFRNNGKGWW